MFSHNSLYWTFLLVTPRQMLSCHRMDAVVAKIWLASDGSSQHLVGCKEVPNFARSAKPPIAVNDPGQ
jgi:deoxyribodipyrimidine photolyase-like uncharacterized protein